MVGSKIYIAHAKQLPSTLEQQLKTFVKEHPPATIAFVRSGDGELAVIETATREQAEKVAAALASSNLDPESLDAALGNTPKGRDLERLYITLKQRELENNWTNRQW